MRLSLIDVIACDASRERARKREASPYLAAVGEEFSKAEFYQWLARKSDAELAAFGIEREQLPRVVMFGRSQQ